MYKYKYRSEPGTILDRQTQICTDTNTDTCSYTNTNTDTDTNTNTNAFLNNLLYLDKSKCSLVIISGFIC